VVCKHLKLNLVNQIAASFPAGGKYGTTKSSPKQLSVVPGPEVNLTLEIHLNPKQSFCSVDDELTKLQVDCTEYATICRIMDYSQP
jgi:hypothetical protein